ncbi:MAG: CvpA family protein [Alphaproteobacteria bacterium]|nr:CvpA family protein [Alphaproteobacteria bacterium]
MSQLNNLDMIILIIVAVSALIALIRGLVKEVLSIVGWFLATAAIIYLLPVCLPFTGKFIASGILAGIITSLAIFVIFFIIWIYSTSQLIGKIRTSKLSGLDRMLGLFFGIMRACLLVVLFYIMVSWIIPEDKQSEVLKESRYYQLAGSFAKPLEDMIPQETLDLIKEKTKILSSEEQGGEASKSQEKEDETIALFEKLAQPKIKKAVKEETAPQNEEAKGYKETEREDMTRLIDSVEQN